MKTNKKFDCVEMKRDIQQRLLEKWKGQTDEEIQSRFEKWAKESDDRLAQWWRSGEAPVRLAPLD